MSEHTCLLEAHDQYATFTATESCYSPSRKSVLCCGAPQSEGEIPISSSVVDYGTSYKLDDHCHFYADTIVQEGSAQRKLLIASGLCLVFIVGEIIGGAMAHSLAVMTDAAHLLTDFASFMISLSALFLASLPPTKRMSFGWHRAEVVGALISVLLIWVVTGILVYLAVQRIIHADYVINAKTMVFTAGVGVLFNIVMAGTLHEHGHSHGDKTTSQHRSDLLVPEPSGSLDLTHFNKSSRTETVNNTGDAHVTCNTQDTSTTLKKAHQHPKHNVNINVRAAFIHVLGDLIQSVGVFIAALIIYFKKEYKIADPICTFVFSVLVLITTLTILRDAMHVLMEGAPKSLDFNEVKGAFFEVPGVIEVHNLRIWSLTTTKTAVSAHLAYDHDLHCQYHKYSSHNIMKEANRMLRRYFNVHDITIQMEPYVPQMINCEQCQDPIN